MNSSDRTELIDNLIPSYVRWADLEACDDGFVLRLDANEKKRVLRTELTAIHPQLPTAISMLKDESKADELVNSAVSLTVSLWDRTLSVQTNRGLCVAFDYISQIEILADAVRFGGPGLVFYSKDDVVTGQTLLLPTGAMLFAVFVEHTWLDSVYPEWRTHHQVASTLDLDTTTVASNMLSKPLAPINVPSLPAEMYLG